MRHLTHPDDEVLAALALGESGVPDDQRRHVADCVRCAAGLEELRHTLRLASEGPPPGLEDPAGLESPGAEVWTAVSARVGVLPPAARAVDHGSGRSRPLRRTVPVGAALLVATLCLVLGVVGGLFWAPTTSEPPGAAAPGTAGVPVATAELDMLGEARSTGSATVSRTGSQIDLTLSLPRVDPAGGYLEVWLLDRDLDRMVSVGVVGDSWMPSFTIPSRLLEDGYVVIDISRQSFAEGPEHSGNSIMRGTLDT